MHMPSPCISTETAHTIRLSVIFEKVVKGWLPLFELVIWVEWLDSVVLLAKRFDSFQVLPHFLRRHPSWKTWKVLKIGCRSLLPLLCENFLFSPIQSPKNWLWRHVPSESDVTICRLHLPSFFSILIGCWWCNVWNTAMWLVVEDCCMRNLIAYVWVTASFNVLKGTLLCWTSCCEELLRVCQGLYIEIRFFEFFFCISP